MKKNKEKEKNTNPYHKEYGVFSNSIIKNKERQVNDMKSIIGDNGNNCHSHLCF